MTLRTQLIAFLSLLISIHALGQSSEHVILISIDGLRPEFYLDPSWPTPTLQRLKSEGLHATKVIPVFPSVTYPNHTSMVTGAKPSSHGIYYNSPFQPLGNTGEWYWYEKDIQVPNLWDALKESNLTSAAVLWPVTVGAPITYNIPDIWDPTDNEKTKSRIESFTTPTGLLQEVENQATGNVDSKYFNSGTLRMDQNVGRMASYLLTTYKPALTALHLISVDHAQHVQGREGYQVREAISSVDGIIATILEDIEKAGMKETTTVIIVGDHGFSDIHSYISPNIWLAKAGIIAEGESWQARFQSGSGSAFLYVRNESPETLSKVLEVVNQLPDPLKDLFTIIGKDQLIKVGTDPQVSLAINPIPGVAVSGSVRGLSHGPYKGGTHGFFPDIPIMNTGMIAIGAGIPKDAVIPQMHTYDIAPFIAKLLGLKFNALNGMVYPGMIQLNH